MKSLFSVTFTIMWFIILVLKYILLCFALLFHFFILKLSHRDKVVWASQPGLDGWYLGSKNISSSFEISKHKENIFSFRENLAEEFVHLVHYGDYHVGHLWDYELELLVSPKLQHRKLNRSIFVSTLYCKQPQQKMIKTSIMSKFSKKSNYEEL